MLLEYEWPGNVRELRNLIEHLFFLGPRRPVEPRDLLPHLEKPPVMERPLPVVASRSPDQSERELIYFALVDLRREVAELRRLIEEQLLRPLPSPPTPVYQLDEPRQLDEPGEVVDASQAVEPLPTLKELMKEAIEKALQRVGGNRKQAAEILGISPRTLYRKLDEYGIK
jgi:DNA-binding NtrC family response regulator